VAPDRDRYTERNKHLVTSGNYLEVLEMAWSTGRALVTWRGRWWSMVHCYWCHIWVWVSTGT